MRNELRVIALLALGCGSPPLEDEGTARAAIVGGVKASSHPEAALIDMPGRVCSGAIIAPRVVLTAGHCVVGRSSFTVTAPYAGNQSSTASEADVLDYPDGARTLVRDRHDVGLVYLDRPIVLDQYPTIASSPQPAGTSVINIGRVIDGYTSLLHLFVGRPVALADGDVVGFPHSYRIDRILERDDSGGPCEIEGSPTHEIVGINSGVGPSFHVIARVDEVAEWIAEKVAAHREQGDGGAVSPSRL